MPKYFLLIAGYNYYPCDGTDDWIECYETYTEADETGKEFVNIGKQHNGYAYRPDWYKVVDLRDWIGVNY